MVPILFICPSLVKAACSPDLPSFGLVVNRLYSTWKPARSGLLEGPVPFNINQFGGGIRVHSHQTCRWPQTGGGGGRAINTVKDMTTIQKNYRNGPSETFGDSAPTNAKSCIQEANAPYSDTGWDWSAVEQLWGPGGQWDGSEPAPWLQRQTTASSISKSMASRSREVIYWPLVWDYISNPASSSGLLRQEKHQQTGASPGEGDQDGWELLTLWGEADGLGFVSPGEEAASEGHNSSQPLSTRKFSRWLCQVLCRGGGWGKRGISRNKFRLDIRKKKIHRQDRHAGGQANLRSCTSVTLISQLTMIFAYNF